MSRHWIRLLPVTLGLGLVITGCASHQQLESVRQPPTKTFPDGELVLVERPPVIDREYFDNAPADQKEAHYWVKGYWSPQNGRWVWIPSHWE
jgi:hypothetical protein